jgi:hypothetical protein
MEDESEFVRIDLAVRVGVTPQQVQAALEESLGDDGDIAGFEITGEQGLSYGSTYVTAVVEVESGMAAMEWQRALSAGLIAVPVEFRAVDGYALQRSEGTDPVRD